VGLIVANQHSETEWSIAFTWWGSSIVCGSLIIGFSEIVRLLHEINERGEKS
jgi:hypothetical protein